MLKRTDTILVASLLLFAIWIPTFAQQQVETAEISIKSGQFVEGPRAGLGMTVYDISGTRKQADDVTAASSSSKRVIRQDAKGNIIEAALLKEDGSIVSKEAYSYEFDKVGNWVKRITSLVVIEDGKEMYEPTQATYRTITYYYDQSISQMFHAAEPTTPGTAQSISSTRSGNVSPKDASLKVAASEETPRLSVRSSIDVSKSSSASPAPENNIKMMSAPATQPQIRQLSAEVNNDSTVSSPAPLNAVKPSVTSPSGAAAAPPALPMKYAEYYSAGVAKFASGQFVNAVEAFKQAIFLNPNDSAAYTRLGMTYLALNQYKEALAALRYAVAINKPDGESHYYLGETYIKLRKYKQAAESLKQSISRMETPGAGSSKNTQSTVKLTQVYYALGLANAEGENYDDAAKAYSKAVSLDSRNVYAYYGLGLTYVALGDISAAQKQQQILQELNPALGNRLKDELIRSAPIDSDLFPRGKRTVFE
jgi:tetratricopeptide (TPR) repeat protein